MVKKELIVNESTEPSILINKDYNIVAANNLYLDKYGHDIVIGKTKCFERSHGFNKPCFLMGESCPLENSLKTNKAQNDIHIHRNKNRSEFCHIKLAPKKIDGHQFFIESISKIEIANAGDTEGQLVGRSKPFIRLISMINKSSKTNVSVLLQGETGTGKELVAKAIHLSSPRKNNPFVIVECTGLNESLFESELFGHEKGAFTGAHTAKKGLATIANEGTLFLDEIGDVPLSIQVKLLRLLEYGTYRPVGSTKVLKSNFRLICASHKNLKQMVSSGTFREDLYYRIASFPIELPNLSQRKKDIPILATFFLRYSEFSSITFTQKALQLLENIAFSGNIRELKNFVERLAVLSETDIIDTDLIQDVLPDSSYFSSVTPASLNENLAGLLSEPEILPLKEVETRYIKSIKKTHSKLSMEQLAKRLGISVRTLFRKLANND